jgi:hypothetical protein
VAEVIVGIDVGDVLTDAVAANPVRRALVPGGPSFDQPTSHLLRASVEGYRFHPPSAWGAIACSSLWIE